jgi:CheY-like chemotaxis protein
VPGRVLVADDSGKIQKELAQLLQEAGMEVVTVSNGEHAVRQLPTLKPDLVLADIFMPVRTGYEVCEYIKNNPDFADTTVLLLVSKMEPFDEKEAQRVGADGRIDKPFEDPAAVLETIKQHLGKILGEKPAPPIEEFAAAVPAAEEEPETVPEAEPEPDIFATHAPPVQFDEGAAPMGFAEMVEEEKPAEATVEAVPAETEDEMDLSQATVLTSAAELKRRIEEERIAREGEKVEEEVPPAEVEEEVAPAEVEEEVAAGEVVPTEMPAELQETSVIEKPELAEAWEMTGPQPGAPEVPAVGGFDSQWSGGGEEAEAAVAEEEPAKVAEEEAAPAEAAAGAAYPPEEFAAAFAGAEGEVELAPAEEEEAAPVEEEPEVAAGLAEELAAAPPSGVDPAVVDEVVNQVLARLSPQVMETIAREIVRPLAEALLKEKLKE